VGWWEGGVGRVFEGVCWGGGGGSGEGGVLGEGGGGSGDGVSEERVVLSCWLAGWLAGLAWGGFCWIVDYGSAERDLLLLWLRETGLENMPCRQLIGGHRPKSVVRVLRKCS